MEYLFTVEPGVFNPPPKVKSAVIRLTRNKTTDLGCDEKLFRRLVKTTFNQRRKMLRNNIQPLLQALSDPDGKSPFKGDLEGLPFMQKRPEQLSVADFIDLTLRLQERIAS